MAFFDELLRGLYMSRRNLHVFLGGVIGAMAGAVAAGVGIAEYPTTDAVMPNMILFAGMTALGALAGLASGYGLSQFFGTRVAGRDDAVVALEEQQSLLNRAAAGATTPAAS